MVRIHQVINRVHAKWTDELFQRKIVEMADYGIEVTSKLEASLKAAASKEVSKMLEGV